MSEQCSAPAPQQSIPQSAIDGLLSQLDAAKQMYNESMNTMFQLRTQAIQMDKINKELHKKVKELEDKLANVQAKDVQPDPAI
jgi:hypothetical protein